MQKLQDGVELIKYERNNELLIFWTNGITKEKFIHVSNVKNLDKQIAKNTKKKESKK